MTPEEYLELGLSYIKEKNWERARDALLESQKRFEGRPPGSTPPLFFSALGLSLAMVEKKFEVGESYCRQAIAMEPYRAELYFHLGLIYLEGKKKGKAILIFRRGLKLDPNHPGMLERLKRLGVRRRWVITFLPRLHFLNKYLGMWLHRRTSKNPKRRI
ncbi:MAG TPA: tetratricopeptide repeat protein [Candidatus Manganitrophaceae bacterium]|nr:tetratricopeptide repeat protein [Candidatus Manganitrophaceae bacterium]